jgi:hypothetical protein
MRMLSILALLILASCATPQEAPSLRRDDPAAADCMARGDAAGRGACVRRLIAADEAAADNRGVGPPPCHPASTRRDPDDHRC